MKVLTASASKSASAMMLQPKGWHGDMKLCWRDDKHGGMAASCQGHGGAMSTWFNILLAL